MRFVLVALLAGLCALTTSSPTPDFASYDAKKQTDIWRLFKYINQPSYYKDHQEIAKAFDFEHSASFYSKPEVYQEFYKYYKYDAYLHKGEVFSVFYEEHLKQAISLFKLFYHATSWETFYKTAVWARNHVNEGLFLYSFSVAIIHRPDTYYYVLPPIYEVYPHYFYSSEVIHEAQHYKQLYSGAKDTHYNDKTIFANYSGHYLNLHPEQSMSYFTEDVGLNSFYYYYNLYYPFWLSGEEYGLKHDNRGELFYYIYQQILARYYLERISNDFGEIPYFNWETPFETGYYPSLQYPNGLEFPTRPNFAHLYEYFYTYGQKWNFNSKYGYSYTKVQDYERRIRDAIDFGYVFTHAGDKFDLYSPEGLEVFGNMIEGNVDSPYYKYYGSFTYFARHLLGYSYQPLDYHKAYPSALEHFETSLRDPAFYILYKKLITYYYKYQYHHKHPYTEHELSFQGVHIKKVEFDRLVTYFDYFHADLSNAVYVTPEEFVQDTFKVHVAQERLTYKPFSYKIYVDADNTYDADVYVYLGPKYDEYGRYINMSYNWMNFVQFDHFHYEFKSGQNEIIRDSKHIYNYFHDRTTYYELYKKAFGVYDKNFKFQFNCEQFWYGFPQGLYLPKGSYSGVPYQFYVYVQKYVPFKTHEHPGHVGSGSQYVSGHPFGYPFDRPAEFEHYWEHIPNGYFYETKIYHRDSHAVNASH